MGGRFSAPPVVPAGLGLPNRPFGRQDALRGRRDAIGRAAVLGGLGRRALVLGCLWYDLASPCVVESEHAVVSSQMLARRWNQGAELGQKLDRLAFQVERADTLRPGAGRASISYSTVLARMCFSGV